jgi:hypothetical protein
VFKGKMTARTSTVMRLSRLATPSIPACHVPVKNEPGAEILWFSPGEELRTAKAVMMKNMQAAEDGSTP